MMYLIDWCPIYNIIHIPSKLISENYLFSFGKLIGIRYQDRPPYSRQKLKFNFSLIIDICQK